MPAAALPKYKVVINSEPPGAKVYLEAQKDAGEEFTTPHTFRLERGTHTLIFEAAGYERLTQEITVRKTEKLNFTLVKKPELAVLTIKSGEGANNDGAKVQINGKELGAVPLAVKLQNGRYLVEVIQDGFQPFREWVDVKNAEQQTMEVRLTPVAPSGGSLLVATNIAGAEVYVDGKMVDTTPALVEKLRPGRHLVEVRAAGHQASQQTVEVQAAKTAKVSFQMSPDQKTLAAMGGTLMIVASHKDVEILVDGVSKGIAPVKVEGLAVGTHVVEARKLGHTPDEQSVELKKGEFKTIKLNLKEIEPLPRTGAIRVVSSVRGAQVLIDGTFVGKTPLLKHQIYVGPHFVTVRQKGYEELIQTLEVKSGQIVQLKAELQPEKKRPPLPSVSQEAPLKGPQELPLVSTNLRRWSISSFGAHLIEPRFFTGDVSFGFPYIFEMRASGGIFSRGALGLDAGLEFRTYGALSEGGLHAKFRFFEHAPFALAALFHFGGGGGPSSRSTIYTNFGAVGSVWIKQLVSLSARAYFNIFSDRHCPSTEKDSELGICHIPELQRQVGLSEEELRDRFTGLRFLLSALVEVPLRPWINIFGLLEGAPFQGNRRAYSDPFAGLMPSSDPAIYGRAGVTFKY
jgi:hypothetical protein